MKIFLTYLSSECVFLLQWQGTDSIESIKLDMSKIKELHLRPRAFSGMVNLKFLEFTYLTNGDSEEILHKVHLPEKGLESLSDELRSFHWKYYPLDSFPLTFSVENLVEFYMPNSRVRRLWDGIQVYYICIPSFVYLLSAKK